MQTACSTIRRVVLSPRNSPNIQALSISRFLCLQCTFQPFTSFWLWLLSMAFISGQWTSPMPIWMVIWTAMSSIWSNQRVLLKVHNPKDLVCLLKKSLYGTKQGRNHWNHKMCTALKSMGFKQTYLDAAVYILVQGDVHNILPAFVNNMTFASKSLPAIKQAITDLHGHFKLHDLGPTIELLGINHNHNHSNRSLTISQPHYCTKMLAMVWLILSWFQHLWHLVYVCLMSRAWGLLRSTHLCNLSTMEVPLAPSNMYLSCTTRPDITYIVGQLTSFTSDPGVAHWNTIKHLFRYIKGTMDYICHYLFPRSIDAPALYHLTRMPNMEVARTLGIPPVPTLSR